MPSNSNNYTTRQVMISSMGLIDLTSLNTTDTIEKIESMVDKVNNFNLHFNKYPQVAAICVYPNFASIVKSKLKDPNVKIAVVGGLFPSSQSFLSVKIEECRIAVEQGADEVDIVLSLNHFLSGRTDEAANEIIKIKESIGEAHLKVILETGALTPQQIESASYLAMEAGANFIKSSTGKLEPSATPQAATIMCNAIKEYHKKRGRKVGFKPAGGIVTPEDAALYYSIVDSVLGKEWLNPNLFRLGASRLANNLLSKLENQEIHYF